MPRSRQRSTIVSEPLDHESCGPKEEPVIPVPGQGPVGVSSVMFCLQLPLEGPKRFHSIDDGILALAGVSAADCLADAGAFFKRIHPDDLGAMRQALEDGTTSLSPWFAEFRVEGPDGRTRWLRAGVRPVRDATGAVVHSGVVIDVSEGKWFEDALVKSPHGESGAVGDAFFRGVAEQLGRALRADATAVVLFEGPDGLGIRGVAGWLLVPGVGAFPVDAESSPFGDILRSGARTWPSGLRERFPRDPVGMATMAEAFTGALLTDSHGHAIGGLGAWFSRPISNAAEVESILAVFSNRAAVEMEHRRAEDELRRSESLLRGIIDNTSALVFVKDLTGRYLLVNRQWCDVFQRSAEEMLARTDHDLFPADLADQYRSNDRMTLDAGHETVTEEQALHGDGLHTYMSIKFPLRDGQGRPFATGGIATDITQRKLTEQALVEERSFVSTVLEMTGSLVLVMDPDGNVIRLNQAAERTLGWSTAEATGHRLEEILVPSEHRHVATRAVEWLREAGNTLRDESDWLARDGTVRRIVWTGGSILGASGEVKWIIGTGQDVTERHRLEVQLAQAHRMESLGRLAGGIAHDFNNLLTPIMGYSDLLLADMPAADRRAEQLTHVHEAAQRAQNLTRQLLAFGKGQVMERRAVPGVEVIESFGRILRRTIRENISIKTRLDPNSGCVMADPTQIEQVVLNLALNAQDAMPRGGTLEFEASGVEMDQIWAARSDGLRPGRYLRLAVSDDGSGMDAETQSHIFEPFFSTKEAEKGTGLGLSTVYGIVRQLEGGIEVHSTPGKGTNFVILLPCTDSAKAYPGHPGVSNAPLSRGTETILVAEDNDMVRELAIDVLCRHGYSVLDASGPERALSLLEDPACAASLLLTDLVMPGMDGRELYRRALAIRPGLKVVYMSGYAEHLVERFGLMDESVPFLRKPFSVAGLTRRVREVLDGPLPLSSLGHGGGI